ncbi:MAG: glutaminyl-peptide cyclotransferase [Bacteroidota bacterium]
MKIHCHIRITCWLALSIVVSCGDSESGTNDQNNSTLAPAIIPYTIIRSYPHDTGSFTQGLEIHDGVVYESTGNPDNLSNNGSWIGKVDLSTGQSEKHALLSKDIFGEGITIHNKNIYRLSWQNQRAFVYRLSDFNPVKEYIYQGEGWGLTNDGNSLIMSNGSNILSYRDPITFKETKQISVHDQTGMKNNLNELEFINGYVFANVWQTTQILKIDTSSGEVKGIIDLSDLVRQDANLSAPSTDVLNGIAWDKNKQTLLITGKKWPKFFELKLQ